MDADVIFATVGITSIITLSWITKPLRRFKLFKCSMCTGVYVGATLAYFNNYTVIKIVEYAAIGSLASYTWYLLMSYFIEKYD